MKKDFPTNLSKDLTLNFDYSKEPHRDIAFVDMKSFYASVECLKRGLHPLKACLCVMSNAANSEGLILASSPTFKWAFGKNNVSRSRELPFIVATRKFNWSKWYREHSSPWKEKPEEPDPRFVQFIEYWARQAIFAPPSMGAYIQVNGLIQAAIHEEIAPQEDCYWYSIDEGFVDASSVLNYHTNQPHLSKKEKLDQVSKKIQRVIYDVTGGIVSTVGMSNGNPLLAKVALDVYAKHERTMRASINYEDVPEKLWSIKEMTSFWGIGSRTEKNLRKIGITSIQELAHANPSLLKKRMGVIGVQLYCHVNGIDESTLQEKAYQPKNKTLGNSMTLPRDYFGTKNNLLVLKELAEQVAIRLRKAHLKATTVSLYAGYSISEHKRSIHCSKKIEPTNQSKKLEESIADLFLSHYDGGGIRRLSISYGNLVEEDIQLISLFDDNSQEEKQEKLQQIIDKIREEYGFTKLLKASALSEDSQVINRSKQIGGHSAGGLDGLQ